jgi:type IV pilus assembly protein PilB
VVLSKRNNRLIAATATFDQQAQSGSPRWVDWIIAEYDKLTKMVEVATSSA